ncbi:hypothetical protein F2Q70_00003385 [Brassica cretica]|uniref:non-specific serine/threonine protein kinase n=1 Tax=Brassica cretica TaxID=69181 RepID=A0A8S9IPC1_BRACR|nr:hypothetical protein F2Q70_00003385 [Brassica cretica]
MTSLFPSTKNHISYRIIWMIFVIPSCVYSASVELHRLCSAPFSCGNQEGLFYPFWISGREACGHPDFKLNCSGGFAEFTISSAKFIILEANSTSRVVRLARSDYTGDLCPPYPLNSPLFNEYVLPFATGTEMMTIYYGCPEMTMMMMRKVTMCRETDRHVSIPADGTSLNTLQSVPTLGSLKKVIADGFKLGANRECWACEYSKGACGYNQSSNGFVCYCIDGHQNVTCGSSSWNKGLSTVAKAGLSTGKKAGIGTALGLVGIILIAGGLFCTFKRRKKTQAAEYISKDLVITSSSKEASNNPTSTTVSYTDLPLLPSVSSTANRSVFFGIRSTSNVYSFGVVLVELISSKEAVDITRQSHDVNLAKMAVAKIQSNALHELVDPSLGFEKDPEVRRKMMSVAELAFRCLQHEREMRPTMDEILKILRGIKEEQIGQDVVDIGGVDVGLLRLSVPPPISPETDTWTSKSSSEDMEAIPF